MYSIVLLAALTSGADAPAFGHRHKGHGCCGAPAPVASSCMGAVSTGDCGGHARRHHGHRRQKHGCCGAPVVAACHGGAPAGAGCVGGAPAPMPMPDMKKEQIKPEPKKTSAPATIVVNLPADAQLSIDGTPTTSTSAQRVYATPSLLAGQDFFYTFNATVVRDGRPITSQQRVRVRAGEETAVRFEFDATSLVKN